MKRLALVAIGALLSTGALSQSQVQPGLNPGDHLTPQQLQQLLEQPAMQSEWSPPAGTPPPKHTQFSEELYKTPEDAQAMNEVIEGLNKIVEDYVHPFGAQELAEMIKEKIIAELDPHSALMSAKEFKRLQDSSRGEFGGIGIEVYKSRDPHRRGLIVKALLPNSAAGAAGVKPGDVIIAVNGAKIYTLKTDDALDKLVGNIGTPLTLTVTRKDVKDPLTFTFVRKKVVVPSFQKHKMKDGYGYVRMSMFSDPVPADFVKEVAWFKSEAAKNLQSFKGLVLDLRFNPGGIVDSALAFLSEVLEKTPYGNDAQAAILLAEEHRDGIQYYPPMHEQDLLGGRPIVVLINGGSASASEITAGVLQLRGRAVIAGVEKSFGKGSVQSVIPLKSGGAMRLTTAQYLIGAYGCPHAVQDIGITPDIWLKRKDNEPEVKSHESDYKNALATSKASGKDCQYHFPPPSVERLKAAHDMLKVFEFEETTPPKTN